jgi:AcrR family transcriptional regulator
MSPISWPTAIFPRQSNAEPGGTFGSMPALDSEVRREGRGDARERLLTAAYELFAQHGVQAVGVDAIIERSGVARQTMYRHFNSKQELVLSFLDRREQVWTRDWLQAECQRRATDPGEQLLAIFDVFGEWFHKPDFEGCSFINVLLEYPDASHPLHQAAAAHLAKIRGFLQALAAQAEVRDPESFARQWHILMKGSIVAAGEGDREAAQRAQDVGRLLLEREATVAA